MELYLQLVLGLVSLICLGGGINLLLRGTMFFLPESLPPQRTLDNIFRFLSGIYFGLGFFLAWVVFHLQELNSLIYYIGSVLVFAGLGRMYSRIKVGSAGRQYDFFMILEVSLGILVILLQYFRNKI